MYCLPNKPVAVGSALLSLPCEQPGRQDVQGLSQTVEIYSVYAHASYEKAAKRLVWKLKFGRARNAGVEIGDMLSPAAKCLAGDSTVVVHVPTATKRVRFRGYDQSAVIAKSMAHSADLPYIPLLSRMGQQQQRAAGRAQRTKQLQEAFWVTRPHLTQGAHVILVDDVVTTGATLEAAAAALNAAGAKRVEAVVFAQA